MTSYQPTLHPVNCDRQYYHDILWRSAHKRDVYMHTSLSCAYFCVTRHCKHKLAQQSGVLRAAIFYGNTNQAREPDYAKIKAWEIPLLLLKQSFSEQIRSPIIGTSKKCFSFVSFRQSSAQNVWVRSKLQCKQSVDCVLQNKTNFTAPSTLWRHWCTISRLTEKAKKTISPATTQPCFNYWWIGMCVTDGHSWHCNDIFAVV